MRKNVERFEFFESGEEGFTSYNIFYAFDWARFEIVIS